MTRALVSGAWGRVTRARWGGCVTRARIVQEAGPWSEGRRKWFPRFGQQREASLHGRTCALTLYPRGGSRAARPRQCLLLTVWEARSPRSKCGRLWFLSRTLCSGHRAAVRCVLTGCPPAPRVHPHVSFHKPDWIRAPSEDLILM